MRAVRWKAVIPLGATLVLVALFWWLFLDLAVERAVEYAGTEIVGARVDLASADVSLGRGAVVLRGLEVTNPDRAMTNLMQADQIVAQVRVLPLLEKKVVIDTMAVRGVRFGTPRRTSGAIARQSPTTGRVGRAVADWANRIRIPPLNLQGLTTVVDVSRINPDSLRTTTQARAIAHQGDSLQGLWRAELARLDPQPQIDSARALIARLRQADVRALGLIGARDLVNSSRASATQLGQAVDRVKAVETRVKTGVAGLRSQVDGLAQARQADYAYARGLVNLPSLDAPDLSPALFGEMAVERLKPMLYWLNLAEQYLPPGLEARRQRGPDRVRASGTTARFPRVRELPAFLLVYAGADAEVGGEGAAAGRYAATITGLTTAPALYGRPTRFAAQRAAAVAGPRTGNMVAILNHVSAPITDSIVAALDGVALPTVGLAAAGATLALGSGAVRVWLARAGDNVEGSMAWSSNNVRWAPSDSAGPSDRRTAEPSIGSAQWVEDLLWRTVSRLTSVEVEVRLAGRVTAPAIGVRSNVGREVAQALRREIGDEVSRQEQRLRAEVDRRVEQQVQDAERRVAEVQMQVEAAVTAKRTELEAVKTELENQIRELTRRLPVRIP
ncbi:MAG: TIGR03545 family protein [Gemmatimonadetes bacterium]|nr:TIGR03545 family protein [Gemmatimonadota bacterium]